MNALDAAFGGGKGMILEKWLKAMDGPGESPKTGKLLSRGAREFFSNMPVVIKKA
jgi:hypothetical protein